MAQETIKKFIGNLTTTTTSGRTKLDEAIRASSSYSSTQDVIDNLVADAKYYKENGLSRDAFLKDKCGIDLNNDDTGAITGFDVGNGVKGG